MTFERHDDRDEQPHNILRNIERKMDRVLDVQLQVLTVLFRVLQQERQFDMATQATLDKLTADVAANTDAAQAAALALTGFVKTTADLTAALQAAIAAAAVDDPAVLKAISDIENNNSTLQGAIPAVSAAVKKNVRN